MKIVLRGGYSDVTNTRSSSFWYEYEAQVKNWVKKGKKIAVITLARQDGYFRDLLDEWPNEIEIIDSKSKNVKWSSFDKIFIPGGAMADLLRGLKSKEFSLDKLKDTAFVLGDSAGAYVLSSYFYDTPPGEDRGKVIKFVKGLNPKANIITMAHTNNPKYMNDLLTKKVRQFAKEKGLDVLMLRENQEKKLDFVTSNLNALNKMFAS